MSPARNIPALLLLAAALLSGCSHGERHENPPESGTGLDATARIAIRRQDERTIRRLLTEFKGADTVSAQLDLAPAPRHNE